MITKCTPAYWIGMETLMKSNPLAPCMETFDDAEQSTQCPHPVLPPAGPVVSA